MIYKYVPDSYNRKAIKEKGLSDEVFLDLQIKYRKCFEQYLMQFIDFKKVDLFFNSLPYKIPTVKKNSKNFYSLYSTLGSSYVYLRNNYHIERLSEKEIETLKENRVDTNYLLNTYERVLFEDGSFSMFGVALPKNAAPSNSLVFLFSYNLSACVPYDIKFNIEVCFKKMFESIEKVLDIKCSYIVFDGTYDVFFDLES